MGATTSSILSARGSSIPPNTTTTALATLRNPAEAGTETVRPDIEGEYPSPSQNPYAKAVYAPRARSNDDDMENRRPRKLRKLRAGVFSSAAGGTGCPEESTSVDEPMMESDAETGTSKGDDIACICSADDGPQCGDDRDSPGPPPEGTLTVEDEAAVNLFPDSDDEDDNMDEWFDAEEVVRVDEGSAANIPSEDNVEDKPVPHPNSSNTVRHVIFSDSTVRFGGGLGDVSPFLPARTTTPPAPSSSSPQLATCSTPAQGCCRLPPPSVTLTPPTPRLALPADRFRERWPRGSSGPLLDTARLFARDADWDLRGGAARTRRAAQDRWAVVRRRRARLQEALRPRVGRVEAWRLAREESRGWAEWARRGY